MTTVEAILGLSAALHTGGRDGDARTLLLESLAIAERTLDPDHSTILLIRSNLVGLHLRATDFAAARAQHETLLATRLRLFGAQDPERLQMQIQHGMILISDGADARAISVLETARAEAPDVPDAKLGIYQMLSVSYSRTGRHEDATAAAEEAVALAGKAFGAEHPASVALLTQLAYVLYKANDLARGEIEARRAVALATKVLPAGSPGAANPANVLALVLCARKDFAAARQHAERAITLAKESRPDVHAEAELALACALHGANDRAAAIAAAERSVALYTKLGKMAAADLAHAQRWLAAHR